MSDYVSKEPIQPSRATLDFSEKVSTPLPKIDHVFDEHVEKVYSPNASERTTRVDKPYHKIAQTVETYVIDVEKTIEHAVESVCQRIASVEGLVIHIVDDQPLAQRFLDVLETYVSRQWVQPAHAERVIVNPPTAIVDVTPQADDTITPPTDPLVGEKKAIGQIDIPEEIHVIDLPPDIAEKLVNDAVTDLIDTNAEDSLSLSDGDLTESD